MSRKKQPEAAKIVENIEPGTLDELMGDRFDIYAKDVIQDRAIPDARDGLKPVQRRIVYVMWKTGNTIEKQTKKCAHTVGEVMGKYHPHGDSSIYSALVRLSQPWIMRVPLVDFQGNNGSIDGDPPAAYRYTEARLSAISNELIRDINKNGVDMGLTFDDTEFEPNVLPAHFPNLLVNGASGIAVGLATEIPPHNLKEVIDAVIYRINRPSCPIESLMRFVQGPDFPTGGIIYKTQGLYDIYLNGRGTVTMCSRTHYEVSPDGLDQIIVTEIPYGVFKSAIIASIDKIRRDKEIDGIDEVRDETDKTGLRIAIDIKKGFKKEAILAYLLSKTKLRTTYSANMIAIVNGRPQTLNLLSYCDTYIAHQKDVYTRRINFDLAKNKARLSIVEGLIKAASIIEEVIKVIRLSKDKADSKANLESRFGFLPDQSEAIVMMPLYKLSHTDIEVLMAERDALKEDIAEAESILSSEEKLSSIIASDLREIAKTYSDKRRTEVKPEEEMNSAAIDKSDLVAKDDVMVALTRDGYLKRSSIASYKGSGGHTGAYPGMKNGDTLLLAKQCISTDHLLMFTDKGQFIDLPVHMIKQTKWLDEGIHINFTATLDPKEKIVSAFVVATFRSDLYIVLATKLGSIKRVRLDNFASLRLGKPARAMKLLSGDEVVAATLTSGDSTLCLFSKGGLACAYSEKEVAPFGTSAGGIKSASFHGEEVVDVESLNPGESCKFALITDMGATRILSSSNINLGKRLSRSTVIFKSFKSQVNSLIGVIKLQKEATAPFTVKCTLSSGDYIDIEFPDLYLTPMDKIAKSELKLPKGVTVFRANTLDGILIDSSTQSFDKAEEAEESAPSEEPAKEGEGETNMVTNDDSGFDEKYEQISIFSDFNFDD